MDAVQHVSNSSSKAWFSSGKGLFRNPGPGWLGVRRGKQTNSGKKRFVSGRETNVSEPWEKVSFRVGNKGFEPEKLVFRPETNVSETGQENQSFETPVASFRH
jgi:hypothetical protein